MPSTKIIACQTNSKKSVVIRMDEENAFGLNHQATFPFNADFDGDEMNLFFILDR